MRRFDQQEFRIVKELIRDPRISDNHLARRTGIPVMTVNRKRKRIEEEGLIRYYASVRHEEEVTGIFHARQLYIIKFRIGLTREIFFDKLKNDSELKDFNTIKHVVESYIGEKDGHLALMMILDAETEPELIEYFNGRIVANMKKTLGEDAIQEVITAKLNIPIRLHHNYLPQFNMEKGRLRESWLDDLIFVE